MNVAKSISEIRTIPFFAQFSEDQIRKQIEGNLKGVESMLEKAKRTGKKVNGFTAEQIEVMVNNYKTILAA
jgi:hypothetical protein